MTSHVTSERTEPALWTADLHAVHDAALPLLSDPHAETLRVGVDDTGEYLEFRDLYLGVVWRARVLDRAAGLWHQDVWALNPLATTTTYFPPESTPLPLEVLVQEEPLRSFVHAPQHRAHHPGPAGSIPDPTWTEQDRSASFRHNCAQAVFLELDQAASHARYLAPWEDRFGLAHGWLIDSGAGIIYAEAVRGIYRLILTSGYASPALDPHDDPHVIWRLLVGDARIPLDPDREPPTGPREDFPVLFSAQTPPMAGSGALLFADFLTVFTALLDGLAPAGPDGEPVPDDLRALAERSEPR